MTSINNYQYSKRLLFERFGVESDELFCLFLVDALWWDDVRYEII